MTTTAIEPSTNARISERDRTSVFHSWSAQRTLAPLPIVGGDGVTVWDADGRSYLDFSSQLVNVNIGHQHPAVVEAIREQASRLATIAPAHANETRAHAAELILERAPEGFTKVFFTNGGADANENAIRMARLATGREKVISHYRSYHGNTGAAISATGDWRRMPNEYSRGHVHVFGPYLYRSEFWARSEAEEAERALRHLERTVQAEGPDTIAALLVETIPGTAGVLVPPPGYLAGVRQIADRYGVVLILDEVMAGFARAGEWFAFDSFGVRPDLITFAKGVNSGYVPLGGVVISDQIAGVFDDRVFPGGLTYSGHPLAAASAVATLQAMDAEGVVDNARTIGETVIGPRLADLALTSPLVGEVRGRGVFWAIELVSDRLERTPLPPAAISELKAAMLEQGLLGFFAENRIHVVPPAIIGETDANRGLDIIEHVLDAYVSSHA